MTGMAAGQDRRLHTLRDIARAVEGRLSGSPDAAVTGAASLADASEGDLSYIDHDRHLPAATRSREAAFVVSRELTGLTRPQIVAVNAQYAFARIVQQFFTAPYAPRIFMATERGTPARSRFLTAVRRKSCGIRPGAPAALQAVFHAFQKLFMGVPPRWNTHGMMRPVWR